MDSKGGPETPVQQLLPRTCRTCKQLFTVNHARACVFHPESFSGETAQRWLPPGNAQFHPSISNPRSDAATANSTTTFGLTNASFWLLVFSFKVSRKGAMSFTTSTPAAEAKTSIRKVQINSKWATLSPSFHTSYRVLQFCVGKWYPKRTPTLRLGCCAATHLTYEDPERLELRRPGMGIWMK